MSKTAVIHNGGWKGQRINTVYHEMAEYYSTAIIPARVRTPKDKPNAEGTVGNISTWITAALSKRKKAAGMNSSATKNCHCWRHYLQPVMNWRSGNRPPFNGNLHEH